MGKGACQLDILDKASWGHKPTFETIPISINGSEHQLHAKVFNILSMQVYVLKYTYKCMNAMCHIEIWEKFRLTTKSIILLSEGPY